jgi:hypothetical protein
MGRVLPGKGVLFAKNSDRGPNEPQVLEYRPAKDHKPGVLRATYIELDQVSHTYATMLSRPVWMWGAEIGVNEHGVCIGNEAVFTKGAYGKSGLTGMDLLRLALERSETAKHALEVIITLLEKYGQGGDCGYDHSFFYDNSFLIADPASLYVLETAGTAWAYKRMDRASISNRLSLGCDADAYSGGVQYDFAGKHLEPIYSFFSGSAMRRNSTASCIAGASDISALIAGLRFHNHGYPPLTRASVSSPCMHAGGLIGDHTTSSMAAEIGSDGRILLWLTGSSCPCISLFKPWAFGNPPVAPVFNVADTFSYWSEQECFRRAVIGRVLPDEYYAQRDALEQEWMNASRNATPASLNRLSEQAVVQEKDFYAKWASLLSDNQTGKQGKSRFLSYWEKKTSQLRVPARQAISGD